MNFTEQAKALAKEFLDLVFARPAGTGKVEIAVKEADAAALITAALQAAYEAGKRHPHEYAPGAYDREQEALACKGIVDCTGAKAVVRPLFGTLPVTADDVVCGIGAIVYTENGATWQACVHNAAHEPSRCEGGDPSFPLHQCYSTREAAEAGRKQ